MCILNLQNVRLLHVLRARSVCVSVCLSFITTPSALTEERNYSGRSRNVLLLCFIIANSKCKSRAKISQNWILKIAKCSVGMLGVESNQT